MLPEVPTFKEAGVPMLASAWYGLMLPANARADVVARLNKEFNQLLQKPEILAKLQDMGAEVLGGSAQDFAKFSVTELKRLRSHRARFGRAKRVIQIKRQT